MKSSLITALLLFICFSLFSQRQFEDQLIIQLKTSVSSGAFFESLSQNRHFSESEMEIHMVSKVWRTFKITVDPKEAQALLDELEVHPDVAVAGFNFQLEPRELTPNDNLYSEQWDMEVINAPEVWEYTTGGVTALGDTIVVANLEDTDIYHEDLSDNIWRNHAEIPNNNIDDDGNGYVDDYFGLNVTSGTDNHPGNSTHGTQVSGIIGAKGDNGKGISGVNWNVKIMVVSNSLAFDEIIEAYEYVLEMRTLYNDTNGAAGAFIVASNASFGATGRPEENPFFEIWCNLYDDLGAVGVLSTGATSNDKVDIDEVGDMPTSCPSDYLVAVTDVDASNKLRGGYSGENVDLGAPGTSSISTTLGNQYSDIGGTSAATPHVAGGIALLYSIPCPIWAQTAKDDPAMAAELMKGFLLNGAAPVDDLEGKTVTGGILDLKGSLDLMQNYCGSYTGPLDLLTVKTNLSTNTVTLEYQTPKNTPYTVRIFDVIGRELGRMKVEPELFKLKYFDIDVSHFRQGVYFLSIENNENIVSGSFVVY